MSTYTAGPWEAGRGDMASIVEGYEAKWVYAGRKYIAMAVRGDVDDWDEVMANAHLIAAAPALEAIAKQCGPFAERGPALDYASIGNLARAALVKATTA